MRHTALTRFSAAALAIWFAVAVAGQTAVHRCPVHDGASPFGSHPAQHGSPHGARHAPLSDHHSGQHCACLQHCCCSPSAGAPTLQLAQLALPPAEAVRYVRSDERALPSALDFGVHFPTGPPVPSALTA